MVGREQYGKKSKEPSRHENGNREVGNVGGGGNKHVATKNEREKVPQEYPGSGGSLLQLWVGLESRGCFSARSKWPEERKRYRKEPLPDGSSRKVTALMSEAAGSTQRSTEAVQTEKSKLGR